MFQQLRVTQPHLRQISPVPDHFDGQIKMEDSWIQWGPTSPKKPVIFITSRMNNKYVSRLIIMDANDPHGTEANAPVAVLSPP